MIGRLPWGVVVGASLLAIACGSQEQSTGEVQPKPDAALQLPDVAQLAPSVQRQLRDQFASLNGAIATSTAPTELAREYGQFGRLLFAAKLGSAAESSFRHAEALMPADRRWPYYRGHVLLFMGKRAEAIAAFERARSLAPDDVPTLIWLAESHLDDGHPLEAEALFSKAASLQPASAAARFGAGRAALARSAYSEATRHLEETLAIDRGATAAHYPLAMAYRALGDRQKSDAHLAMRGETWPNLLDPLMEGQSELLESVTSYESRGVAALSKRDWAAAAAAFRRGLDLQPDDPALRHRLGSALYSAGDEPAAIKEFEDVVRRSPDFVKARVALGTMLSARGRFQLAIEQFSAAVKTDAVSLEAQLGMAEALRMSGKPEAAIPYYTRATQLDPTVVEGWLGGAAALITLRRQQQARDWLANAGRVHPNHAKLAELARLVPP